MAYYPILIDWQGVPCLIAGGGQVALHKARVLLAQGADVTVVAPEICPELAALPVKTRLRRVESGDAEGVLLAVDATGDEAAQRLLARACREKGVLFNSACALGEGSAVFPAVQTRGRTILAVSTLGASPGASARLRDRLAQQIPESMDAILDRMAALRALARERLSPQSRRRAFLSRCVDRMLASGAALTDGEVEALLAEFSAEQ